MARDVLGLSLSQKVIVILALSSFCMGVTEFVIA